jgi:pyruvate formate-lyase activating enzyme-like uncharacterized protein
LGDDLDGLCDAYLRLEVEGIGFSGGEPFLLPDRVLDLLLRLRARNPGLYFWAYTNGLLITKDLVTALAEAGLHELRFNMAATGYFHPWVTAMLRHAVTSLPSVTVEIPAIPEDGGTLRKAICAWSKMGVKHLNLHDLIYETGTPSETMSGARVPCRLPDGHRCEINPESSELVADVFRDVDAGGINMTVNYCSLGSKVRQLRGRRRLLAATTVKPWESHHKEDEVESVCYFNETQYEFAHPTTLEGEMRSQPNLGVALVRRLLPLTADGAGQWTHFELLQGLPTT